MFNISIYTIQKFIKNHLISKSNKPYRTRQNEEWFKSNDFLIFYNYILKIQNQLDLKPYPLTNTLKCIMSNQLNIPVCTCGNLITYKHNEYKDFCCIKCSSKASIEKTQNTKMKRYGNRGYNNRVKSIKTNIIKYGVENVSQIDNIKELKRLKSNEKYGVNCVLQSDIIKHKIKQTNIIKYGVENASKNKNIIQKIKDSHIKKYGDYFSRSHIDQTTIKLLNDRDWLIKQHKIKTILDISHELNVSPSLVSKSYIKFDIEIIRHNSSKEEKKIKEFLDELNIIYYFNNRNIISPLELDFYLPDYNLAIEVNGIYWHSELQGKNRNYHLNKTELCENLGIKLIQIYDNDINNKWELIKSRLESKLGISSRIYARKCNIVNISTLDTKIFLNENHIQGNVNSSINYGLIYNNELVSIMTFGKARFSKADYELLRFCNNKGFSVIGGASRLFKKFKYNYDGSIISYADRNWSNGNLYEQLGFNFSHNSPPNYRYTKDYILLESRNKYMKHKLNDQLGIFDPEKTEWENMKINGYDRIWDCGNKVYITTPK